MSNEPTQKLTELYLRMVKNFPGGISNTSTAKFNEIKSYLAKLLGLTDDDLYIVGAGDRTTNLPIRLTQGGQATKKTELGVGFYIVESGRDFRQALDSATTSTVNYLAQRGRGNYNAILLVAIDANNSVNVARLVELRDFKALRQLQASFPNMEISRAESSAESAPQQQSAEALPRDANTFDELLIKALAAKQFVIIAGGTGTGKTRAAKQLARAISSPEQTQVVAVGADWTDNRALLGFRNLLSENGDLYIAPPALRLLLKASKEPTKPFFLILDEMNLSHVERYFSDFLSSMESGEKIKLHDAKEDLLTEDGLSVPGLACWPGNLFVIGTVNIDETTYMFSPKVLDRAHVIEFKVEWDDIKTGLSGSSDTVLQPFAEGQIDGFMRIALNKHLSLSLEDHEKLVGCLELLHKKLENTRFTFAHRTARECLNYVAASQALESINVTSKQTTESHIDRAILQKALPKIHGSSGMLSTTLPELINVTAELKLGQCNRKLQAMSNQMKHDQFVSFIQ